LARGKEIYHDLFKKKIAYTGFSALNNTWKTIDHLAEITSIGEISAYLERTTANHTNSDMVAEEKPIYQKKSIQTGCKRTVAENVSQSKIDFNYL